MKSGNVWLEVWYESRPSPFVINLRLSALESEQLDLVGDIREEEHVDVAGGDVGQIRVELGAHGDQAIGEEQLPAEEDLGAGFSGMHIGRAQLEIDLAAEGRLRDVFVKQRGASLDDHGLRESCLEPAHVRIGLEGVVLLHHLAFQGG